MEQLNGQSTPLLFTNEVKEIQKTIQRQVIMINQLIISNNNIKKKRRLYFERNQPKTINPAKLKLEKSIQIGEADFFFPVDFNVILMFNILDCFGFKFKKDFKEK